MKIQIIKLVPILLALTTVSFTVGCGAGKQPVEVASQQDVDAVKDLRKAYDSAGGDYTKLTDFQKKQFLAFTKGDQAAVDSLWKTMGTRVGGGGQTPPPNSAEEARKKQMHGGPGQ